MALRALLLLLCLAGPALAEPAAPLTAEQEQRAASLYGELKCPVCKSQSVAASTSFLSEEMKRQIRDLLAQGKSDQEILDYFVARYGEWILLRPKARGRGLWAWAVPGAALLLGLSWLGLALRRWSASESAAKPTENPTDELSADQRQRIQALIEG